MFSRWQFGGPARQQGAIGLMAALTLAMALGFTVLVIDTGRLYLEQRKLQRVADTAALEAVTRNGNCLTGLSAASYATQSAARNGFTVNADGTLTVNCGTLQTGADNLRAFTADASKSVAVRVIATHNVPTSVAAGVGALLSGGPVSLTTRLSATAVAASPLPPVAQLGIRSTLVDVSLLNPLFGSLLGNPVNVSLVSWNALLGANINLLNYMDQLAIDLRVTAGDYDRLLQTDATVGELIKAAATVARLNGATASAVAGLDSLVSAAVSPVKLHLGDLLKLQTGGQSSGLDADLNALQLIQAFVQLANSKNAVAATLPVNLLGLGLGATASIKVIEPPQFSVVGNPALAKLAPQGANQIYVRTAQVRVLVTLDLSLVTGIVGFATGALSVVTGLLGLDLKVLPSPNLDVSLEAGGGSSYVTDYTCVSDTNKSLVVSATTAVATLRVGKVNSSWASSAAPLTVTPITLLDIGQKPCGSCARIPFAGGGADLMINSPALQTTASHTFVNPSNVGVAPVSPYTLTATDAIAGLSKAVKGIDLTVHAPTFNTGGFLPIVVNTLLTAVNGVLAFLVNTLSGILSPLLDDLLNKVLLTLGIDVGKIQVDANLTCGQKGKAYLVI